MEQSEKTKLFCLYLKPGIGPAGFFKLITHFKKADSVFGASFDDIRRASSMLPDKVIRGILSGPQYEKAEIQFDLGQKFNVKIISFLEEDYPSLLSKISNPPPFLFIKGRLTSMPHLGVVGTRHPSGYGINVTRFMVETLSNQGIAIISGMAKGIDAAAHWQALDSGGYTAAVLGSGLDTVYPKDNTRLFHKLGECGALLTEHAFGTPPEVKNFPLRNRIISGMTLGTLVVEAGSRSGALITARYAKRQGKYIFAVPGSLFNRKSDGCHQIIRQGGSLVRHPVDICRQLKPGHYAKECPVRQTRPLPAVTTGLLAPPRKARSAIPITLSEMAQQFISLLENTGRSLDELCALSGSAMHTAITILLDLEARGLIERRPGSLYYLTNPVRC
jgi:DNA processing protein